MPPLGGYFWILIICYPQSSKWFQNSALYDALNDTEESYLKQKRYLRESVKRVSESAVPMSPGGSFAGRDKSLAKLRSAIASAQVSSFTWSLGVSG